MLHHAVSLPESGDTLHHALARLLTSSSLPMTALSRASHVALQRLQSEIAHRGFYSFKVSAADFLDPYDARVRSKPELYEVAMNSQLSSQLSDSTIVTVGGAGSPSALRF